MAPRILVVDDNQELLSLLTQLFEDAGYEVLAASRGKQALEVVRLEPPGVAVLDILLPDMMGYHLADALRKEQPQLPLLFITGVFKGGKHALEARQKYGAAGYFEKPFEAQKLLEAVAKLLPAEKRAPTPASLQDAFEVELDLDVEDEGPQEAMELTGRIKVTVARTSRRSCAAPTSPRAPWRRTPPRCRAPPSLRAWLAHPPPRPRPRRPAPGAATSGTTCPRSSPPSTSRRRRASWACSAAR
jgi:CheY-like chemotaxis protein